MVHLQRISMIGDPNVGRIVASVTIQNVLSPEKSFRCDALVDMGAGHMTLPSAWRDQLGEIRTIERGLVETATQSTIPGEICGPAEIQVEGFRPVMGEVLFVDMEPIDGFYEPLIGYLVLEAIPVAVDMLG